MNFADYPDVGRLPQVAEVVDCDVRTVRKAIDTGELEAVFLGKSIRVTKWALAAWLKIPLESDPTDVVVHPGPGLRVVKGGP